MRQIATVDSLDTFLQTETRPDLYAKWKPGMEIFVMVQQDNGIPKDKNKRAKVYVDPDEPDGQAWHNIRLPRIPANLADGIDCVIDNSADQWPIKFSLNDHAHAIGGSGWNYRDRRIEYVGFDFDAIIDHIGFGKALEPERLDEIERAARLESRFEIRWSTSGNGKHIYVPIADTKYAECGSREEVRAIAKYIIDTISATASFAFNTDVDHCGDILWLFHRKYKTLGGLASNSLKLIQPAREPFELKNWDWRNYLELTTMKRKARPVPGWKLTPEQVMALNPGTYNGDDATEMLEAEQIMLSDAADIDQAADALVGKVLDPQHREHMKWLHQNGAYFWFDQSRTMLVCHTYDLARMADDLKFRGKFITDSQGSETGADQNAFAFPLPDGAWVVRRHTKGVEEHKSWFKDGSGWTCTYLNRYPRFEDVAKSAGTKGKKGWTFDNLASARNTLQSMGFPIDHVELIKNRDTTIERIDEENLKVWVPRNKGDDREDLPGWVEDTAQRWAMYIESETFKSEEANNIPDDVLRFSITPDKEAAGWYIMTAHGWVRTGKVEADALSKTKFNKNAIAAIGAAIESPWMIACEPFQPEYPTTGRVWNLKSPRLIVSANPNWEPDGFPTWESVLNHIGTSLTRTVEADEWCQHVGILTGGDYLAFWIAFLLRKPKLHLPYLFLYSMSENTGKSTLHEALSLLINPGVARADQALQSQGNFNGELENAVLCVIEETNFGAMKGKATTLSKLKDWITGSQISIHRKGKTPYLVQNSTHWIHSSNDMDACPVSAADTRITMIEVPRLEKEVPKDLLQRQLAEEAPHFLGYLWTLQLPDAKGRLSIPALNTPIKEEASAMQADDLSDFLDTQAYRIDGAYTSVTDLYNKFIQYVGPSKASRWSRQAVERRMRSLSFPRGLLSGIATFGNIALEPKPRTHGKVAYVDGPVLKFELDESRSHVPDMPRGFTVSEDGDVTIG